MLKEWSEKLGLEVRPIWLTRIRLIQVIDPGTGRSICVMPEEYESKAILAILAWLKEIGE